MSSLELIVRKEVEGYLIGRAGLGQLYFTNPITLGLYVGFFRKSNHHLAVSVSYEGFSDLDELEGVMHPYGRLKFPGE